ncbi:MAG: hypothetical protein USCAAHI_02166 [Beijerinckiaceae bacterium]|nr:MAG: hypothetical protein USCAAHI_02166 [Beijerinckiaceae bacterium]
MIKRAAKLRFGLNTLHTRPARHSPLNGAALLATGLLRLIRP